VRDLLEIQYFCTLCSRLPAENVCDVDVEFGLIVRVKSSLGLLVLLDVRRAI
jgi:hypothetical protein